VSERKPMTLHVTGEPPLESAPALFCNFLGVSRLGTDVQFEFIFVDINQLATLVQAANKIEPNKTENSPTTPVMGQTVAKIVMPAQSFVQLQHHFEAVFKDIRAELDKQEHGEQPDARKRINY
jgi:hypothetical protein